LSIDFGGVVAKALLVEEDGFDLVEVPLGFKTHPRPTIPEALRYVISQALPAGRQAEAVYASGEIASVELKEILTKPPLDPIEVLSKTELPIIIVGAGMTYVNGQARRRENMAYKAEEISRWLPFRIKFSEIQNYFANKEIYPQLIPTTEREIKLEQAAARVRIQALGTESASGGRHQALDEDYVIASGGVFSKAPSPSCVVSMLLDALQPKSLLKIYLDQEQIVPALSTLAVYEEERAQEIFNQQPFAFLGTTFSAPEGVGLKIDLGLSEPQELEVDSGELAVFPLDIGQTAQVKFETGGQNGEFEAEGGPAGLVIDTRERPLELSPTEGERLRVLQEWEEGICRYPLFKK